MPRSARKKSETGIYHITMRGINRQQIFIDDEDAARFLQAVQEAQAISQFRLYAYCLMGNHVHLVLEEGQEALEKNTGGRFLCVDKFEYTTRRLCQENRPRDTCFDALKVSI